MTNSHCTIQVIAKGRSMELLASNVDNPGKYLTPWESRVYLG